MNRNEQENFWSDDYAKSYMEKNSQFDLALGASAWNKMIGKIAGGISNYLECGSNIGRNVEQISRAFPHLRPSIIEIAKEPYNYVTRTYKIDLSTNGTILESDLPKSHFDLVFTMGVLIHIDPDSLGENIQKMFEYSRKYILVGEYFNRTPTVIEYQGQKNKLFKRDFGKYILEHFECNVVDYGFLWGHIYDDAGFDDVTWWLFEK